MTDIAFNADCIEQFANDEIFMEAVRKKHEAWDAFMQNSVISSDVNPTIAQSWIRSKAYGIDPYRLNVFHLSDEELAERREKRKVLLQYAGPIMNTLAKIGAGHISLMSLHDSEGYMLELNDQQRPEVSWRDECFRPGVRWREEDVGTNGIGLVLIEKRPIQIIGQEHYNYGQRNICCCAAPIMDSDGTLIGALNVCAQVGNFSQHMMTLVVLSCYAITNQLVSYSSFEVDKTVLSVISECVIVLDQHLHIIRCSDYAAKLFRVQPSFLIGLHIQELIHIPELGSQWKDTREKNIVCRNCNSYFNGRHLLCDVHATPIHDGSRNLGTVLTVRSSNAVAKDIASTVGNYAQFSFEDIVTSHPPLLDLIEKMKQQANLTLPVLLCGESGTGKELYAHAIHAYSDISEEPFITVNCASMPTEALKHELFGCEKGVFNGPFRDGHLGKLELCNGGAIFLDGIDRVSLEIQRLLLRLLKTHRLCRCGGLAEFEVNLRIYAATHSDLADMVRKKLFLEELYQVLSGLVYTIPPLRSRPNDIALLAKHTVQNLSRVEYVQKQLSPQLMERLRINVWPGNGRELCDSVTMAFYACDGTVIMPEHMDEMYLRPAQSAKEQPTVNAELLESPERRRLLELLQAFDYDVERTADALHISRATMYRRLKKYDISIKNIQSSL